MRYYPEVQEIVVEAVKEHPTDINAATDQVERGIRGLDCFEEIVSSMIRAAARGMIWNERHRINVEINRENGIYATRSKVNPGSSPALQKLATSALDLYIAGRTIGSLKGGELLPLAVSEREGAAGKLVKARLLELLDPLVREGQMVRAVVSDKKANKLFQQAQREINEPGE